MKATISICLAMACSPQVRAEEPSPEIAGLQQAAADFVTAYNNKDAAAIAALFTEEGEISDLNAEDVVAGRADIEEYYKEILSSADAPSLAVEVASVRFVAPNVAVEDGTVHFTPPGEDEPARSMTYTAVLAKNGSGAWQVASTRGLGDATAPEGHLGDLADLLKGDWTGQRDGVRIDLAFGWDDTGKFISGEILATSPDVKPLTTTARFGWDGAKKTITCWSFDGGGGFATATWTPDDADGWTVRTEGTTADGESMSANQHLVFENQDTFIWTATDRLIDGEKQPDTELRVVRRAPEPAADEEDANEE